MKSNIMKDLLGQEINIGDTVLYIDGNGTGFSTELKTITKMTEMRIYFAKQASYDTTYANPESVIKLTAGQMASYIDKD